VVVAAGSDERDSGIPSTRCTIPSLAGIDRAFWLRAQCDKKTVSCQIPFVLTEELDLVTVRTGLDEQDVLAVASRSAGVYTCAAHAVQAFRRTASRRWGARAEGRTSCAGYYRAESFAVRCTILDRWWRARALVCVESATRVCPSPERVEYSHPYIGCGTASSCCRLKRRQAATGYWSDCCHPNAWWVRARRWNAECSRLIYLEADSLGLPVADRRFV